MLIFIKKLLSKCTTSPGLFVLSLILCSSVLIWHKKKASHHITQEFFYENLNPWLDPKASKKNISSPKNIKLPTGAEGNPLLKKDTPSLSKQMDLALQNISGEKGSFKAGASHQNLNGNPPSLPRPSIALILTHAGGINIAWEKILTDLPLTVALAFQGYHPNIYERMDLGAQKGFECLKMIPMEPMEFPLDDPGTDTLLTGLPAADNIKRLEKHLSKLDPVGVTTFFGSRFTACVNDLQPIIQALKQKNLLFIDLNSAPRSQVLKLCKKYGVSCAKSIRPLDRIQSEKGLDAALQDLEKEALSHGKALGFAKALPYVIQGIKKWHTSLKKKGIDLIPLSIYLKAPVRNEIS